MAEEWVDIKHDGIDGVARVALSSYTNFYKSNGWRLVEPDTPAVEVKIRHAGYRGEEINREEIS